jgi:hypothetical protein
MQDYSGNAYVFCIDAGRLSIFKAGGKGNIEAFVPEGMPEKIENVRHLEISEFGSARYAAFIGKEGPAETIHILTINPRGIVRYFPVPETRTAGSITDYRITGFIDGSAVVYFLAGGRLYCVTGISGPGPERRKQELNVENDTSAGITGFDIAWNRFRDIGCIWFTIARKAETEVNFYVTRDNKSFIRSRAGNYSEVSISMSGDIDHINCTLTSGTLVEIFRANAGGFSKKASFTGPEAVNRYFNLRTMGILIGKSGNENTSAIYGVTNEFRGLPFIIPWIAVDTYSVDDFFYFQRERVSIFYKRLGFWHSAEIDTEGRITKNDELPGLKSGAKVSFTGRRKIPEIYFIDTKDPDKPNGGTGGFCLKKYEFKESGWKPVLELPIPGEIISMDSAISSRINNRMFLAFNTRESLALYRMED